MKATCLFRVALFMNLYLPIIVYKIISLINRHLILLFVFLLVAFAGSSQIQASIATDLTYLRSIKKSQRFGAMGQTIHGDFHYSSRDGLTILFSYYTLGKFKNQVTATAKSPNTAPQNFNFFSSAQMRIRHFSVGWKRYLIGSFNMDGGWNLYGYAGFGLLLGSVTNTYDRPIDTSLYNTPAKPLNGIGKFKRLTFDLGAGWEIPIGIDIYFFTESRVWIPATSYPTNYLLVSDSAPLLASLSIGIRILFQ
jgi:hypothetical protein